MELPRPAGGGEPHRDVLALQPLLQPRDGCVPVQRPPQAAPRLGHRIRGGLEALEQAAPVEAPQLAVQVEDDRPAEEVHQDVVANRVRLTGTQGEQLGDFFLAQVRQLQLPPGPAGEAVDGPPPLAQGAVPEDHGKALLEPQRQPVSRLRQAGVDQLVHRGAGVGGAHEHPGEVEESPGAPRVEGPHARRADAGDLLDRLVGVARDASVIPRVHLHPSIPRVDPDGVTEGAEQAFHGLESGLDRAVELLGRDGLPGLDVQRPPLVLLGGAPAGAARGQEKEQGGLEGPEGVHRRVRRGESFPCGNRAHHSLITGDAHPVAANTFSSFSVLPTSHHGGSSMAVFRLEVDAQDSIVIALITDEDGTEHDYEFEFDPTSGTWDFDERDMLLEDYGDLWVDEFEEAVEEVIEAVLENTMST